MDQPYVCAVLCPYMLEAVLPQGYAAIYMDSVLNLETIYITENTIHYIHCLILRAMREDIMKY